jgi:dTMP kinase
MANLISFLPSSALDVGNRIALTGSYRSRFISFEGIDGAGKSTQIAAVRAWLADRGYEVVVTREPGGTPLGERLRELILQQAMAPDTEALLINAARAEHLAQVIRPALARGAWVLCDRFADSTLAYQGYAKGGDLAQLRRLQREVVGSTLPYRTYLFDLSASDAAARRAAGREQADADKFERAGSSFQERVRAGFQALAQAEPGRFMVLDAGLPAAQIQALIEADLAAFHAQVMLEKSNAST